MPNTPPALSIENVSISYGVVRVVHDADLQVLPGESYGLMGLNGAGKTTMIKAVLGLRSADTGSITVFGQPSTTKESKSQLAYLPERFEPPWFLSGLEFLKFSLKLYRQPYDEAAVLSAAENLGLGPAVLKRRVQTYSKGMRQKLGLLGTILTNCSLLILDEPMSGLDPVARAMIKDLLKDIKAQGRTVFLSSHILADMDEICDRVSVLHEGTIQFTGKPSVMKKETKSENLERAFLHYVEKKEAA